MRPTVTLRLSHALFAGLMGVVIFLIVDALYGNQILGKDFSQGPHQAYTKGWYGLKANFYGTDFFGPFKFLVQTDAYGFRIEPGLSQSGSNDGRAHRQSLYQTIFLGDSFTYGSGLPWSETFVGQFAAMSGERVINAGVGSYSPTPYLYQYQKALEHHLLAKGHRVVIGIDVSDVQDEAGYWVWDEARDLHPTKHISTVQGFDSKASGKPTSRDAIDGQTQHQQIEASLLQSDQWKVFVMNHLPMTTLIYQFLRKSWRDPLGHEGRERLLVHPRSAITWRSWKILDQTSPHDFPSGYAPLGVAGGLANIAKRVQQISVLAKKHDASVYLLIYPWPAQIHYPDQFDWSLWAASLCRQIQCAGVIDAIPVFREHANYDPNWLSTYYLPQDAHFNRQGNALIANALQRILNSTSIPKP